MGPYTVRQETRLKRTGYRDGSWVQILEVAGFGRQGGWIGLAAVGSENNSVGPSLDKHQTRHKTQHNWLRGG